MGSITFTPQYLEPTATHYRAALEVATADGELAKLVIELPRSEAVDRVAKRIAEIVKTAPVGADLATWADPGSEGYARLVEHEGKQMILERAAPL